MTTLISLYSAGQTEFTSDKKTSIRSTLDSFLGPDAVVGLSVGSIAELNTIGPEVDYIGIGPVFSTKTKVDAGAAVG